VVSTAPGVSDGFGSVSQVNPVDPIPNR
jgi:hypothetical protein